MGCREKLDRRLQISFVFVAHQADIPWAIFKTTI